MVIWLLTRMKCLFLITTMDTNVLNAVLVKSNIHLYCVSDPFHSYSLYCNETVLVTLLFRSHMVEEELM